MFQIRGLTYLWIYTVIFLLTIQSFVEPLFTDQARSLKRLDMQVAALPQNLRRWAALEKRREEIESRFETQESQAEVRTYLEKLSKEKVGIEDRGLSIRKFAPVDFGGRFEQVKYNLGFKTEKMDQVVQLLQSIQDGSIPLVIGSVNIQKRGVRLDVQLEISSISLKAAA